MSLVIEIDTGTETLRVQREELPVAVGGPAAKIPLAGIDSPDAVAHVGFSEDQFFIQPAGSEPVLCNGAPVVTSQWLYDGDVVRIGANRILVSIAPDRVRFTAQQPSPDSFTVPPAVTVVPSAKAPATQDEVKTVKPAEFRPGRVAAERGPRRRIRPWTLLLWLPLPLLVLVAWFVLTARSVEIVVEPAPDRMELRGGMARLGLSLGGRHLIRSGTHTLTAEKEGYRPLDEVVEVTRDSNQSFRFELRRLPDLLVIDAGGVEGAEVTIDGRRQGVTPVPPLELEPGEHEVRITSERYREFSATVTAQGGGETRRLKAELVPLWAAVSVSSRPPGATIRANGDQLGVTPATLELTEGAYALSFELAGHKPYSRRIQVVANEPQSLPPVTLQLTDGKLAIRSEPSGATVTVDGVYRGITPLEIFLPPGKSHEIDVSKVGHETATRNVTVRAGRTVEENIELPAQLGEVTVSATPADAELFVDGESRGPANQSLRLVAVPHQIEVRRAGHETYRGSVTPRPGFPQSVEVALKSEQQLQAEATPPLIRTSLGQELVLVEGGRLRMGASRREPGRRANETLRDVELARPFYIASKEVSNGEYRRYDAEHISGRAGGISLEADHHPVVNVTWEEAALYCNWLSAQESLPPAYEKRGGVQLIRPPTTGYRLPTEAEWALVARSGGGGAPIKYPWGDSLPIPEGSGNYGDAAAARLLADSIAGYDDHYPGTAPVDSFEPNALGLFNLGGNVAEWVHDYYKVYRSSSGKVDRDPLGPVSGEHHVIRGAGWMDHIMSELRLSYREYGDEARPDVGFRIARYAE